MDKDSVMSEAFHEEPKLYLESQHVSKQVRVDKEIVDLLSWRRHSNG